MRLLLVDPDSDFCRKIADFFSERSIQLDVEAEGKRAVLRAESARYDMVLLEWHPSGMDGLEVLRHMRDRTEAPILMMGANAKWKDRVASLDSGADGFLMKPFVLEELLAHVRTILRRTSATPTPARTLQVGDLSLRRNSRSAFLRGRKLDLTSMEWEILEKLTRCCGRAVTRDELSLHLHGRLSLPFQRAVDTHVSRIRRKLGNDRGLILSVRGTGYQVCPAESARAAKVSSD
jgi:DNA-binding response OmpR family regulator